MVSRVDRGATYVALKMQWNVKKILTPYCLCLCLEFPLSIIFINL